MEGALVLVVLYGVGTNSRGLVGAGWGLDLIFGNHSEPFLAYPIAPVGHRGAIERQLVLKKLLIAGVVIIWVLDPQFAHTASSLRL
jgi:hypothetical protein